MAHEPHVDWGASAKRLLWPWRGSEHKAKRPKREAELTPAEFRAKLSAARMNACRWLLQAGILTDDLPSSAKKTAARMQERWSKEPGAALSLEEEALTFYWFARHWGVKDPHDALIKLWIRCAGPVFALEALQGARSFMYTLRPPKEGEACHQMLYEEEIEAYVQLRRSLAYCDDATFQAAQQKAASLFEQGDLRAQVMLAFAFPDQSQWAKRAAGALEAAQKKEKNGAHVMKEAGPFLLGSGAAPAICERLDFGYDAYYLLRNKRLLYCYLDLHGPEAFGLFRRLREEDYYVKSAGAWLYNEVFAKPLSMIVDPRVAELMVKHLEAWVERTPPTLDMAYLKAHADLARPIIAKVKKKGARLQEVESAL